MKRILFVDDEPNVVQGLKRMMRGMRDEFESVFAMSGTEAMVILEQGEVDMIISDMRMPEMDGAELIEKVMKKYPTVIRLILSGHSNKEMIMRATRAAHQFLAKPCDAESLRTTIRKAFHLRDFMRNEEVTRIITGIDNLPSLSGSHSRLLQELNSDDPSIKRVCDIISTDVTMTAKVLQLVNSAFFGLPRKTTNLQQAITLLGINTLKALVLCVGIFNSDRVSVRGTTYLEELWKHSMMVGSLAKEISYKMTGDKNQADIALVCGILHDIGRILLLMVPDYQKWLISLPHAMEVTFLRDEYERLKVSHAEVGAYLMGIWGFPDDIMEVVTFHHLPSKSMNNTFSNLTAVHVADALALAEELKEKQETSSFLDFTYLQSIGVIGHLEEWKSCFQSHLEKDAKTR